MAERGRRVLVLLAALVLAGCATVPTSGPVVHHTVQAVGPTSGVEVEPLPPQAGASQLLVVEGFLHAMSTYQPDYAIARQYLTEAASAEWQPTSGVQVYAEGNFAEVGETVMLVAPVVGSLDQAGSYTAASDVAEAGQLKHDFGLVRDQNGQWRIANPPPGLLVSRYVFTAGFTQVVLHYLAEGDDDVLVPDIRFFASGEQAVAAAIRAQLGAPSAWLAPAVRPATSGLSLREVTVGETGLAEVTISESALRLDGRQTDALLAQLTTTLASFRQITAVEVRAGRQLLSTQAGFTQLDPGNFTDVSAENLAAPRALFAIRKNDIASLQADDFTDATPVSVVLPEPETIAVRSDLAEIAATTGGGTAVVTAAVGSGKATQVRSGRQLLRPDFARNGELWTFAAQGPGSIRVFDGERQLRPEATELPQMPIVAAKLSPDGTRLAVVCQDGRITLTGLAVVVRAENAIRLVNWRTLAANLGSGVASTALDVGWASATELAVLQKSADGDTSVVRVSQDGSAANDIGPTKSGTLRRLAVVPERPAVALTDTGVGYRFVSEFDWTLAVTAVTDLTYSG